MDELGDGTCFRLAMMKRPNLDGKLVITSPLQWDESSREDLGAILHPMRIQLTLTMKEDMGLKGCVS